MLSLHTLIPRQVGHTTAVCKAAKEVDGVVVVGNMHMVHCVKDQFPGVEVIAVHQLGQQIGRRRPILFDPTAVQQLQGDFIQENKKTIETLKEEVALWMSNAKNYDKARMIEMKKRDEAVARAEKLQKEVIRLQQG